MNIKLSGTKVRLNLKNVVTFCKILFGKSGWKTLLENPFSKNRFGKSFWKIVLENHFEKPFWKILFGIIVLENHFEKPFWKILLKILLKTLLENPFENPFGKSFWNIPFENPSGKSWYLSNKVCINECTRDGHDCMEVCPCHEKCPEGCSNCDHWSCPPVSLEDKLRVSTQITALFLENWFKKLFCKS